MVQCFQRINDTKIEQRHDSSHQKSDAKEHDTMEAMVMGRHVDELNNECNAEKSFAQQCMLEKGLRKFGKAGQEATVKEM